MRLVLSASKQDIHLLKLQADRIAELGGISHVRILVVSAPGMEDLEPVLGPLRKAAAAVQVVVPKHIREEGWPVACNDMFMGACTALYEEGNKEPFYFMEPDCCPMREGWFGDLATEYAQARQKGKLYLGSVTPTRFHNKEGEEVVVGTHMAGTGIYPAGFPFNVTQLWRYLYRVAWDIYFADTMVKHVQHTELIQHNWGSCKYWKDAFGTIRCEAEREYGIALPVREGVAVVHGCKDESVYRASARCKIPAHTTVEPIPQPEPLPEARPRKKPKKKNP